MEIAAMIALKAIAFSFLAYVAWNYLSGLAAFLYLFVSTKED